MQTVPDGDLSGLRCIVVGGSGFIGTNLCHSLRGQVRELRAFSRSTIAMDGVEWLSGDFLNDEDIERAVENVDLVFHLISTTTPASSNAAPLVDAEQNILQTLKLLEACRQQGVRKIVFVSSGGTVYGNAKILPTPETHPEQPICAYGVSKLAIEKYLHLYEKISGITSIILRVSNPYGPYQHAAKQQGVIGTFIRKSLGRQPIEIWGDGSVMRDYIYIDDVVEALRLAAVYNGPMRTFNIGSGKGVSLADIADMVAEVTGSKLQRIHKEARLVDVAASILDCSRAARELGWKPRNDLHSGLVSTLDWFRTQGDI